MSYPRLTLTGVDGRTSASWIKEMGRRFVQPNGYPAIEFAILRSPKVGQSPRYPTAAEIQKITNYVYPGQLAFHLCGRYAQLVHSLEWGELCDIVDFSLVNRVQVNSTECDATAMLTLQRFSLHIGKPVVMQWREGPDFPVVPRVHILQDRSGGRGIAETDWFRPASLGRKGGGMFFGYAGGLNPDNIVEQLPRIRAAAGGSFWVDCESGIRTDDWLDQEKAEAMARAVVGEPQDK